MCIVFLSVIFVCWCFCFLLVFLVLLVAFFVSFACVPLFVFRQRCSIVVFGSIRYLFLVVFSGLGMFSLVRVVVVFPISSFGGVFVVIFVCFLFLVPFIFVDVLGRVLDLVCCRFILRLFRDYGLLGSFS